MNQDASPNAHAPESAAAPDAPPAGATGQRELDRIGVILLLGVMLILATQNAVNALKAEAGSAAARKPTVRDPTLKILLTPDSSQLQGLLEDHPQIATPLALWVCLTPGLLAAGLAALIAWPFMRRKAAWDPISGRSFAARPWGAWGAFECVAVYVGLILILGVFLSLISSMVSAESTFDPGMIAMQLAFQAALVTSMACLLIRRHGARLVDMGVSRKDVGATLLAGAFGFLAIHPLVSGVQWITRLVVLHWGGKPDFHPLIEPFVLSPGRIVPVLIVVLACAGAPLAEEFFFRGVLQGGLRRQWGPAGSIAFAAALFATVHSTLTDWPPLFILGMMLGYVYERTGNLLAPVALHAIHNGTTMATLGLMRIIVGRVAEG